VIPEGITRRLIGILSADVKDYTRLMSQDDVGTIRTLAAYKEAMEALIHRYRGHVVDATGDNLLARFESVLDAVNCAAEMQRELAERNAELPDHRRMEFRMGISLGDVVEEEGRIFGDGVNIVRLRLTKPLPASRPWRREEGSASSAWCMTPSKASWDLHTMIYESRASRTSRAHPGIQASLPSGCSCPPGEGGQKGPAQEMGVGCPARGGPPHRGLCSSLALCDSTCSCSPGRIGPEDGLPPARFGRILRLRGPAGGSYPACQRGNAPESLSSKSVLVGVGLVSIRSAR